MSKFTVKMKEGIQKVRDLLGNSFYHDPLMIGFLTVFSLLLVLLLLLLIFRVDPMSASMPMSYNIIYGVTNSASWYGLYAYLLGLMGLGALNFLIAWAYFDKERLISYLIACANILLVVLTTITVYNLTEIVK